jgi:hypothetical protein
MILPAARFDGLQFLDVQQPGPLVDHLLKMPQHLAGIAGQLHGPGHVAPGPAVVFGSVLRKRIIYLIFQVKQGTWFFLMFC